MDKRSVAEADRRSREYRKPGLGCFACYRGVVYIGVMVPDENGEEVEVIEPVPCRRCLKCLSL